MARLLRNVIPTIIFVITIKPRNYRPMNPRLKIFCKQFFVVEGQIPTLCIVTKLLKFFGGHLVNSQKSFRNICRSWHQTHLHSCYHSPCYCQILLNFRLPKHYIKHIVISVVIPKAKFINIPMQILQRYMMIYAIHAALQGCPEAFYVIRVNRSRGGQPAGE